MENKTAEPLGHERDINRAIHYLETVDCDRYLEGGTNTEIASIVLARLGKNVRTIKNILLWWFILFWSIAVLFLLSSTRHSR